MLASFDSVPGLPARTEGERLDALLWELLGHVTPDYDWKGEPRSMATSPRDHEQLYAWLQGRDDVESIILVLAEGEWRARIRSNYHDEPFYGASRSRGWALVIAAIYYCTEMLEARRKGRRW